MAGADLADDDVRIDVEAWQGAAAVGRVVATGARAATLAARRVLVGPLDPCGECDVCRRGGAPVCPRMRRRERGDTTVAAARWVVPLAEDTAHAGLVLPDASAAAVAGDAALAYTMYARTGIAARDPVVVVGTSAVARFLVEILLGKGVTPVVAIDATAPDAWATWVTGKGAVVAAGPAATERDTVAGAIATLGIGAKPWRVLVAHPDATARGAALCGPRATLTLLPSSTALPADLVTREVTVIGVAGAHPDLVVEVGALCVKGELDLAGGTTLEPGDATRALLTTAARSQR